MTKGKKKKKTLVEMVFGFIKKLGDPQDIKATVALLVAVATTVWALTGIQGTVRDLTPEVNQLRVQATTLRARVTETEQKANRLERELDALQRSRDELNRIIRQAVRQGIRQGIQEALEAVDGNRKG